jgi:hypothetical protein
MKNLKIFAIIGLGLLLAFTAACKKSGDQPPADKPVDRPADKYAEVRETVNTYIALLETFGTEIEAAQDAKAVAAAMNKLNDAMLNVAPKIKTMTVKFPELNDDATTPKELQPFMVKMTEIHPKMMAAMEKANQFSDDPGVKAAKAKFAEIQKLME